MTHDLEGGLDPMTLHMFVFPFGSSSWQQSAVVLAESADQAREMLLADIERNRQLCPHEDPQKRHRCHEPDWPNGFRLGTFSAKDLAAAAGPEMAPWTPAGPIAYIIGGRQLMTRSGQPRTRSLRDADAEYRRQYRAECRARLARDPGSVEHGRPQTYRDYGCRCTACRQVVAAEHVTYKPKRPRKGKR